jgi:hypothetical protein
MAVRLAGSVQVNAPRAGRARCDMTLRDLGTGRLIRISEERGPAAQGCRLDHGALEEAVGLAATSLEAGADLLIINKFSKREIEGRGFRALVERAVALGVPVLTAINAMNEAHWRNFSGDLSELLLSDIGIVRAWCSVVLSGGLSSMSPQLFAAAEQPERFRLLIDCQKEHP